MPSCRPPSCRLSIWLIACAWLASQAISPWVDSAQAQGRRRGERGERFRGFGGPGGPAVETTGPPSEARQTPEGVVEAKPAEPPPADASAESPPGPPVVTRDQAPAPTQRRIELTADDDGRIRFNFHGEAWPAVLEWLADISGSSLDWQELPGDYLNLQTQRSYSLPEARDLINMHLLARGYTMLRRGEVLSVAKLDKLNPSLVPYVPPEELAAHDPHEFVRTTFKLDWLVADSAAQELRPLLSPFGKLAPMKATNRLEACDAVINLRELGALLAREQAGGGEQRLVEEFKLRYARAVDAVDKLRALLGMEKPRDPNSFGQMRMAVEETRMRAELVRQLGKDAPGLSRQQPEVFLAVNENENSILANAPPDKMALIRQALQALDAPQNPRSPLQAATRMRVYRLSGLDPERVVSLLDNLRASGDLDPATRLEADEGNGSLIAYAAAPDQMLIGAILAQLDAAGRRFEVIPLANLDAVEVAGTVEYMLGAGPPAETEVRNWRRRGESRQQPQDQFRVEADVQRNQLLLWATEAELAEVRALLAKLDARTGPVGDANVRVIRTPGDSRELLRQLERLWPSVGANRLEVVPREAERRRRALEGRSESAPQGGADQPVRTGSRRHPAPSGPAVAPDEDVRQRSAQVPSRAAAPIVLALNRAPGGSAEDIAADGDGAEQGHGADELAPLEPDAETARRPAGESGLADAPAADPPVRITEGPDGQLIITSPDSAALDRLERLLQELAPPQPDYRLFRLRHAWAPTVRMNLEAVFGAAPAGSAASSGGLGGDPLGRGLGGREFGGREFGGQRSFGQPNGRGAPAVGPAQRLSRRQPLKFISDLDTNTILVQHADPEQLRTIEELIEFYDQPEPEDSQSARRTEIVQIQHSRASQVAEVVKEVYRDLLSANDKALAQNQEGGRNGEQRRVVYLGGELTSTKKPQFKGQLSVGVDDVSNQLVISAPEFVIQDVLSLVRQVDRAAAERNVAVVALGGPLDGANMREVLARVLGQQTTAAATATPQNRPNGGRDAQWRLGQPGGFRGPGGGNGGFGPPR